MSILDLFRKHKIPTATDILTDLLVLRIKAVPLAHEKIKTRSYDDYGWILYVESKTIEFRFTYRAEYWINRTIKCPYPRLDHQTVARVQLDSCPLGQRHPQTWTTTDLTDEQEAKLAVALIEYKKMRDQWLETQKSSENERQAVDLIESLIGIEENEGVDPVDPQAYNDLPLTINERRKSNDRSNLG